MIVMNMLINKLKTYLGWINKILISCQQQKKLRG